MGQATNTSHARLGPSAAKRWIQCPASVALCDGIPDVSSSYAEEGTLAHAYCAKGLKEHLGQSTAAEDAEIALLRDRYYKPEMDEYVAWYVDHVWAEYQRELSKGDALLMVEEKLDISEWVPECFGTADALVVSDEKLLVCDFKYGAGVPVSAHKNPQLLIYALGAMDLLGWMWGFSRVELAICQPRVERREPVPWMDSLDLWAKKWHETAKDIYSWGRSFLKPAAAIAWNSHPDMRRNAGEWCRFCKARKAGLCEAGQKERASRPDDGAISWLNVINFAPPTIEYKEPLA